MSNRAQNWVWAQQLPPAPKLILLALADAANHVDECWPGIPFLAQKCCVSERTVQRVLQQFEIAGLMVVTPRYTPAGRQTSNGYRLCINAPTSPDNLSPIPKSVRPEGDNLSPVPKVATTEGDNLSPSGVTPNDTHEGVTVMSPLEPLYQSKQQPLHFPQQLSSAEKQAASQLIAEIETTIAQALLDELTDALDCKNIKTNPLRWFHAMVAKQKSGAFFPVGGIRVAERRQRQQMQQMTQSVLPEQKPMDRSIARDALVQLKKTFKKEQSSSE
jgi:hypothetical protein